MPTRTRPSNGPIIDWRKRRHGIAKMALPLFMAKPWANVTIEDVAAHADMSFWQVYYSFDGQEDVYRASVTLLFDSLAERIAEPFATSATVLETVTCYADLMAKIMQEESYRQILYLRIRDESVEPWLGIQYRKRIAIPLVQSLKMGVAEAGKKLGLAIAVDDEICWGALASLEASFAFPYLLHNAGIDEHSRKQAVSSSAKKIWSATYTLDEPMRLSA